MINKDITINGIKFTKKELAKGIDRNKIPVPHHWEDKDGNYICDFNSLAPRIKEYESRELHLIIRHLRHGSY